MLDGDPEGIPKFIGHWMLRSALIMPGLAIAGVRDRRLVTASIVSSTFVSLFLVTYTAFERKRRKRRAQLGRARNQNRLAARNERFARARRMRQLRAGA